MSEESTGKIIDPTPVLRLLLEPRSLVITHGALYTDHLHGIPGTHHDVFASSRESINELETKYSSEEGTVQVLSAGSIANKGMLGSQDLRDRFAELASQVVRDIHLERRTRVSLTCRVVEKTSKVAGKLLRLK
jgi:hypothetical protein